MFKSLVFSSSNTSINSTLSIDKFKTYSEGNGRSLFIINCAQCHFTNSLNIAPALDYELMSTRTNSWLYTYLRDRKNVIQDSLYLDRKKRFKDNECRELSEYSKEEVIQLISYLKG